MLSGQAAAEELAVLELRLQAVSSQMEALRNMQVEAGVKLHTADSALQILEQHVVAEQAGVGSLGGAAANPGSTADRWKPFDHAVYQLATSATLSSMQGVSALPTRQFHTQSHQAPAASGLNSSNSGGLHSGFFGRLCNVLSVREAAHLDAVNAALAEVVSVASTLVRVCMHTLP